MKEMPSTTADKWFYEEKGQRLGGIDEPAMITLIQSGKLGHGSSVWKQGFADWVKLEETPLRIHLDQISPPPLMGQHVSNTLVWVLAFAPIIGYLLESLVAGLFNTNEAQWERAMAESHYWYVTLLLNITLSVFDSKRLKQAGHDISRFKGWVFVVPVYLYLRAKLLNQNLAYFITWIACFVISLGAHQA